MYKIEFGRKADKDMVILHKCPVSTVVEAKIVAIAKVRNFIGDARAIFAGYDVCVWKVILDSECVGYCRITKL